MDSESIFKRFYTNKLEYMNEIKFSKNKVKIITRRN